MTKTYREKRDEAAEKTFKGEYIKRCNGCLPGPSSLFEHGFQFGSDFGYAQGKAEQKKRAKALISISEWLRNRLYLLYRQGIVKSDEYPKKVFAFDKALAAYEGDR